MIIQLVNLSTTQRACGNCEFWQGAREIRRDGTCVCLEKGSGFCSLRDDSRPQGGILEVITESQSQPDCFSWHPARVVDAGTASA